MRSNRRTKIRRGSQLKRGKRSKLLKRTLRRTTKRRNSFKKKNTRKRIKTNMKRGGRPRHNETDDRVAGLSEEAPVTESDAGPEPEPAGGKPVAEALACEDIDKCLGELNSLKTSYKTSDQQKQTEAIDKMIVFVDNLIADDRKVYIFKDYNHGCQINNSYLKYKGKKFMVLHKNKDCKEPYGRIEKFYREKFGPPYHYQSVEDLIMKFRIIKYGVNIAFVREDLYDPRYGPQDVKGPEKIGNGIVVGKVHDTVSDKQVKLVLVDNIRRPPTLEKFFEKELYKYFQSRDAGTRNARIQGSSFLSSTYIPIKYINSDCRTEIQKPLGENIWRQMIILPSQLNAAEHPDDSDNHIPRYNSNNTDVSSESIRMGFDGEKTLPHWFRTYIHDKTGGPIGQLSASLEVAQEVVRISEANIKGRRDGDFQDPLPINYVREVIKSTQKSWGRTPIRLKNGYLKCKRINKQYAEYFVQNMDKMKVLMSVDNPVTGLDSSSDTRNNNSSDKVIDMVYASAIPIRGSYGSGHDRFTDYIGINVIMNQYFISLLQAYTLAKQDDRHKEKLYQVLVMPLGTGVFRNPPSFVLIGLREAINKLYSLYLDAHNILDIRLLFYAANQEETFKEELKNIFSGKGSDEDPKRPELNLNPVVKYTENLVSSIITPVLNI